MNITDLAAQLLSPEEKSEMQRSMQLLEAKDYAAFYEKNRDIVYSILFLETADEFLDFSTENALDMECFCAAFLCAKGYGIQIGGYEDDLTQAFTKFFGAKRLGCPEVLELIEAEKIYTDCGDFDNFKPSMDKINHILDPHGMRVLVLEDSIYCDCEYTLLLVEKTLAENAVSLWQGDSLAVYL